MFDKELAKDLVSQVIQATEVVLERSMPVKQVFDFTDTPAGKEKLDAVCMLLIAIGESIKKLDKISNGSLLPGYPQIEWKKVAGLRDILSHHYFDVNAEAIFDVCKNKIPDLQNALLEIIKDLSK